MRALVVTENTTVDGRIEMIGDWFQPSPGADFADVQEEMARQDESCDAILVGRRTFLDSREYWPDHEDEPAGASLARTQKFVVSQQTLTDPGWKNTTLLTGDPMTEIRRLKAAEGGEIVLTGSVSLCQAVFAAGLVDELRLSVYPALQGAGKGLLAEGTDPPELTLIESRSFRSGVTLLRYRVGSS